MDNVTPLFFVDEPVRIDRRLISENHMTRATEAYVPGSLSEHAAIREKVKRRILLAAGLRPGMDMPEIKSEVSGGNSYHGVRIKSVRLRTAPAVELTGSLFLPENVSAPLPGILSPHGHWEHGRMQHDNRVSVIMRCWQLARLGFAVLSYDMIGYNDNNTLMHSWQGKFKREGDFYGISVFGLQTLNSLQAVNFLASRPEVDPQRIGCTGASGGASQCWFAAALDERIKVIAPVCMLSSHFQGGCGCEEGPLLRVSGLTNFDIVASLAPRPLFLPGVSGDWTNLNTDYEIPRLKEVYSLYGAADAVGSMFLKDTHNYNRCVREHVYAWLVKNLQNVDRGERIPEEEISPPPPELLWHNGREPEKPGVSGMAAAFPELQKFYGKMNLPEKSGLEQWQREKRKNLAEMLQNMQHPAKNVIEHVAPEKAVGKARIRGGIIGRRQVGDRIVSLLMTPDEPDLTKELILLAVTDDYRNYPEVFTRHLLQKGQTVRLIELTGSGSMGYHIKHALHSREEISSSFDESFFSMRVNDIITTAVFLAERGVEHIRIAARGSAVPAALAAAALTGIAVSVDLQEVDESIWENDLDYQPLMGQFGGIKALLMLNIHPANRFYRAGKYREVLEEYSAEIIDDGEGFFDSFP